MNKRSSITLNLIIAAIVLVGCAGAPSPTGTALTQITVLLRWTHNAQFAGFYAADQNGYYAEEGLRVAFVEGGPGVDLFKAPLDGSAQFGVHGADALLAARERNQPVQAIAVIYR